MRTITLSDTINDNDDSSFYFKRGAGGDVGNKNKNNKNRQMEKRSRNHELRRDGQITSSLHNNNNRKNYNACSGGNLGRGRPAMGSPWNVGSPLRTVSSN